MQQFQLEVKQLATARMKRDLSWAVQTGIKTCLLWGAAVPEVDRLSRKLQHSCNWTEVVSITADVIQLPSSTSELCWSHISNLLFRFFRSF